MAEGEGVMKKLLNEKGRKMSNFTSKIMALGSNESTREGIEITFKKTIPWKRIEDLFVTAFEGGSNYWYTIVGHNKGEKKDVEFLSTLPAKEGGWVDIKDKEDHLKRPVRVDRKAAEKGLKIMATKYPRHFDDFMRENDDAETADVFLQCCVFGKIIFG